VHVRDADGREETLTADAIVCALGSYSPLMLSTIGVPCSVYPAKGYSITIDIGAHRGAPTVSLTDLAWKIVTTRLGTGCASPAPRSSTAGTRR
jgi:D-amino-acid dehydrogenase